MIAGFALLLFAVTGTVTNRTTDKPQAGATVTLYKLSEAGPEAMTSVKSAADGAFSIPEEVKGGPHMLQTAFDGVVYNNMLPPGRPTEGVRVEVYNATSKPGAAKVTTHMILLEPNGMALTVNESIIWRNEGNSAFNDPKGGTMKFFLPPAARGKVKVLCTAPQGMPIERAANKTAAENIYGVDFAIKPGETRFDLTYSMPMTGPGELATKIVHGGGPVRVVAPVGVTITSPALKLLGQEPSTQASVFEATGADLKIGVEGTGALRADEGGGGGEEGDGGEGLKQIRPRLYDRFLPILGLVSVMLTAGLLLLYRKEA